MEIERKWMVNGWLPSSCAFPLADEQLMRQGYLTVRPTVRIREEASLFGENAGHTEYILCFKTGRGLVRNEIEIPLSREDFGRLEAMIEKPLIPKLRRVYFLGDSSSVSPHNDGLHLEVNLVDEGAPTQFFYAEIEFPSEEAARTFDPASFGLGDYLSDEVTETPGSSMGEYWIRTRSIDPDEDLLNDLMAE